MVQPQQIKKQIKACKYAKPWYAIPAHIELRVVCCVIGQKFAGVFYGETMLIFHFK